MSQTDISDTESERRNAAAQRLHDYISTVVSAAPPLTDEQRDRLATLLRPGGDRP
jgi:hypothetical protein